MIDYKSNQQTKEEKSQTIGALKLNYIIYFYLAIILFAPAYTYHMAVSQGQEKPFPHATVTSTACHYPQATLFRWFMTSAGGFLTLIFHVVFRYYEKQAKKYEFPGGTYSYMYWPSILSVIGYEAAICTIDIGGTGSIHGPGAVYFFICLYFLVVNLTIVSYQMRRWDTRFMTKSSLVQKIVVATYLSIIWTYCLLGLIFDSVTGGNENGKGDKYVVIVEWNLVYAGLIWILCFLSDMKGVYLIFRNKKSPSLESILNQVETRL